ncbi:hypothetical protein TWF730_008070 [Orbilia blumenaviensis]|uniref:Nucleoside phosphorylase domain-containing protein n=1 Tax=Orbilia blumenaviensis TaxID=1796055 RepID=A0AAV9VA96_9PEZI
MWTKKEGKSTQYSRIPSREDYTVGWICALPLEMAAARIMLDGIFEDPPTPHTTTANDTNSYTFGSIGAHNVVVACLPSGVYGTTSAAIVASQMCSSFPSIRFYLMVGIGGGAPSRTADIRLGDIVVSKPSGKHPGVIQYDFGKAIAGGGFQRIGALNKPPLGLLTAVSKLESDRILEQKKISSLLTEAMNKYPETAAKFYPPNEDVLFSAEYHHAEFGGPTCDHCDSSKIVLRPPRKSNEPMVHYGLIASGNQVMKDGQIRDQLSRELGVYCFEMEAAGLMDFDTLVVRGICDYSDSHKNKSWQEYAAATAAAYAKELLLTIPANKHICIENEIEENQKKLCLQSLSFQNIDARLHNISSAHEGTCDWFFETESFLQWRDRINIESYNGVLWIQGKPGAGKSTLMKHSLLYLEKKLPSYSIAAYFFNARGTHLEKSSFGMLRSLLYQLLDKNSDLYGEFIPHFLDKQKKHSGSWEWHQGELKNFILNTIRHRGLEEPAILLIDALDECERNELRDVVSFLEDLSTAAVVSGTVLNICLSSRHYPTIRMKKMLRLTIEERAEHYRDVAIYVQNKLGLADEKTEREIIEKAQGIFMWVVLVVEILSQAFEEGRIQAVQKKLQEVPSDLDEVFLQLIEKDNPHIEETILILQWVLFAKRPLNPQELYYAVLSGTDPDSLCPRDPQKITAQTIQRFIISTSRGLVELRKEWQIYTTQFIHETVKDFLVRNGRLQRLDPTLTPYVVGNCHDRLSRCCLSYLKIEGLEGITSFNYEVAATIGVGNDSQDLIHRNHYLVVEAFMNKYPFISYSAQFLFYHAEFAQSGSVSQLPLLRRLRENPEIFLRLKAVQCFVNPMLVLGTEPFGSLLYSLCLYHCSSLIEVLLQEPYTDVNAQGGKYFTALQVVTATSPRIFTPTKSAVELVQVILEAGANVNAKGGLYGTALQAAVVNAISMECYQKHKGPGLSIIRYLLEGGADTNAQCGLYETALQAVLFFGPASTPNLIEVTGDSQYFRLLIIKRLLDAGADPNVGESGPFGNVIGAAIINAVCKAFIPGGDWDTAKAILTLFLESGADIFKGEKWTSPFLEFIYAVNQRNTLPHRIVELESNTNYQTSYPMIVYDMQKYILKVLVAYSTQSHTSIPQGSVVHVLLTAAREWLKQDGSRVDLEAGIPECSPAGYLRICEKFGCHLRYSTFYELLRKAGAFKNFNAKSVHFSSTLTTFEARREKSNNDLFLEEMAKDMELLAHRV